MSLCVCVPAFVLRRLCVLVSESLLRVFSVCASHAAFPAPPPSAYPGMFGPSPVMPHSGGGFAPVAPHPYGASPSLPSPAVPAPYYAPPAPAPGPALLFPFDATHTPILPTTAAAPATHAAGASASASASPFAGLYDLRGAKP